MSFDFILMSTQGKVGRVTKITKALESLLVMVIFLSHVPNSARIL